jgi:hypothetical protein
MHVLAFDRDWTVDVNPHPHREAVALEWVLYWAHDSDHEVWAIGNQDLVDDADGRDLEPSRGQKQALDYDCPSCGAASGRKCQQLSGHRVRTPDAARTDILEDSEADSDSEFEQVTLC